MMTLAGAGPILIEAGASALPGRADEVDGESRRLVRLQSSLATAVGKAADGTGQKGSGFVLNVRE
jgi:hypothetical protein